MNKKYFAIAGIVIGVLVVLGGIGLFVLKGKNKAKEVAPPEQGGKLIETTLEERPYVTMTPRADGKEFTLDVSRIQNAQTIEYEMTYLSEGLSRGVVGSVKLKAGETQISRKMLLGTCSKNVCKYDEGVSEGTLTLRFRGEDGVRKFTSEFHLQKGDERLTSMDEKFKLEGTFPVGTYYLTMSTIGLPGEMEGEILGGPYASFTAGTETVKGGQASLEIEKESPEVTLLAWTGNAWQTIKGAELEGKILFGATAALATFIASAPEITEAFETTE